MYTEYHKDVDRHSGELLKDERRTFFCKAVGVGKKVLDAGCRNGAITQSFAGHNTVVGLDVDPSALEEAAELDIETRVFDLNGEWFFDGEFDVVVMTEVLEHLYHPDKVVERVARALKRGGKYTGTVPNAFSLKNRFRLFFAKKRFTPLGDPTHINHFSHKELEDLLEKHFETVNITPLGRWAHADRFWPGMFSFMLGFEAEFPKRTTRRKGG